MLNRLFDLSEKDLVTITKKRGTKSCNRINAFESSSVIKYTLSISRKLGCSRAFLCAYSGFDNEKEYVFELEFEKTEYGRDFLTVKTSFSELLLCDGTGLVFCYFHFVCDDNTSFYTKSLNNVDFELTREKESATPFRILFYDKNFDVPEFPKSSVMYHIFVDRFNKGTFECNERKDIVKIEDWLGGEIEFPEYAGAPMKNNTFFGGNLYGIIDKLDYLKELGISVLYLSPIFKAYSNHKYDTGDYENVDEMFGGNKALSELITKAHEKGMKIILDGVFNHTGDDSKYFNKYASYSSLGAFQSKDSPYYHWFSFEEHPEKYSCWWGIKILPKLRTDTQELREFFTGENGIVRKWLREGIDGWRLDVADELPNEFLDSLRTATKDENNQSLIIGEVWENAADKISYGKRRKYFLGNELDSVMNYPIKNAITSFALYKDATEFYNRVTEIYSSYPPFVSNALMNVLGTHDTERVLTLLSGICVSGKTNEEISKISLSDKQKALAEKRLRMCSIIQFTLPGMPSIFYGDEAGVEGFSDPFCRKPFPWGHENKSLTEHYKKLCRIKKELTPLHDGVLSFIEYKDSFCVYERRNNDGFVIVAVNCGESDIIFDAGTKPLKNIMTGNKIKGQILIPCESAVVLSNTKSTL